MKTRLFFIPIFAVLVVLNGATTVQSLNPPFSTIASNASDTTNWKKGSIDLKKSSSRLLFSYPNEWKLRKDNFFGYIEFSYGPDVSFTRFDSEIFDGSAVIHSSAKSTIDAIQEYLTNKGFQLNSRSTDFFPSVEESSSGPVPPKIVSRGRKIFIAVFKNKKYYVRVDAKVYYFKTYSGQPDGYANLLICPEDSYDSKYESIFTKIEESFSKEYKK